MEGEYYKTKASVEEYIRMAEGFDGGKLIEQLKAFLPEGSRLLEIGSGPGTDWNILKEVYDVIGSDNSVEFLKHLQKENPEGEFLELDAITLATEKTFNGVYANKVLHHLNDEELKQSVERQAAILSSNGVVCFSFWKGEDSEVFNGLFVNYQNEETLKEAFGKYFDILLLKSYQEFDPDDSLLLIAKKR
ncbi:class I SAM-dependent methyltransferase [Algivirga pacifica]|uniref:Methyltransferase domain-containing protein n=1 Tax=Algivirga pacifica TaxID=1162670 RepID=A0ABP9DB84_9BACT